MKTFVTMDEISHRGGVFGAVSILAEIFDSPLPEVDPNGEPIDDWLGLFRGSVYGELFIPNTSEVNYHFADDETKRVVTAQEFVAWQLANADPTLIYYIVNKVDGQKILRTSVFKESEEDTDLEWGNKVYAAGWLSSAEDDWLNEYAEHSMEDGLEFIRMCLDQRKLAFSYALAECVLNEYSGLGNAAWFEGNLIDNFDLKESYSDWDVRIMCVSRGTMHPYIERGVYHLSMDDCMVEYFGVRNYDEK